MERSLSKSLKTVDVCISTHLRAFSHNKKRKLCTEISFLICNEEVSQQREEIIKEYLNARRIHHSHHYHLTAYYLAPTLRVQSNTRSGNAHSDVTTTISFPWLIGLFLFRCLYLSFITFTT